MKKIQKLKKILEKEDTEKGVESFKEILSENTEEGSIKVQDLNLLLRWAVTEQKKHFQKFYQILTKMGASVNFIDTRQKKSNLMIACEKGSVEIVENLVNSKDMDFMLEDVRKKNALYYCIDNKNKEKGEKFIRTILTKCPQLLSKEANTNSIPLVAAIEKSRLEIIKTLLELGADPNEKIADNGNTPLHEAVKTWKSKPSSANQQIIQNLLQNGADPSIKNKQNKNAIDISEKHQQELLRMIALARPQKLTPIFKINTPQQREQIFDHAAAIFRENEFLIREPQLSSDSEESEECSSEGLEIYEQPRLFLDKLSLQIHNFSHECMSDWSKAQEELQKFLEQLEAITANLNLTPYVYGSFATRLWLKHCDIDILLIPSSQSPMESIEWYLDEIYRRLKQTKNYNKASILKSIKVPMIRIDAGNTNNDKKKGGPRKFDITIMGMNHNGKNHVMYITNLMTQFPVLQPLFYVVKKLSFYYKLNDPKNFGVRSYALILMLALFLNDYPNPANLGELLLSFFYKFGYTYEYEYRHFVSEEESMLLNLPDPINPKNNLGSQTDGCSLQRMFKTAYIILHTKGPEPKLSYLFDSRNIFS